MLKLDNWILTLNPKPLPTMNYDWDWQHVNYDGAPDSDDKRCGTGETEVDCLMQIIELLESN